MTYRLLIDYEALDYLASLKKPVQRLIHQRLKKIQDYPSDCSDYVERDPSGRALHVTLQATMRSPTGKTLQINR
jgi:hypothetical protein